MKKSKKQRVADARKKIIRVARVAIASHGAKIGETWKEIKKADVTNRPALLDVIIQEQIEIDKIAGIVDEDDDSTDEQK